MTKVFFSTTMLALTMAQTSYGLDDFKKALKNITDNSPYYSSKQLDKMYAEGGAFDTVKLRNSLDSNCRYEYLKLTDIQDKLLYNLKKSILNKNSKDLSKLGFTSKIKSFGVSKKLLRSSDKINEYSLSQGQAFKKYLDSWQNIEYVDVQITDFHFLDDENLFLNVMFDIRGQAKESLKIHDTSIYHLTFSLKSKSPVLSKANLIEGKRVSSSRSPYFKDLTNSSGLNKVASYLRTEAIRRGGYALSVTDINNDKIPDLYIGLRDESQMWIGQKDSTFKLYKTGLEKHQYIKTAVFADFDRDGDQDVIINKFINKPHKDYAPPIDVLHYTNDGKGNFKKVHRHFAGLKNMREPMPSSVADFDNDGYPDLYVGYPGIRDFSNLTMKPNSDKRMAQGFYLNDRKGTFYDFTDAGLYADDKRSESVFQNYIFPHSSLALDFDQDHDMDLLVIDDRGHLSPLYVNQGKAKMSQSSKHLGVENYGFGMSATAGDINSDGHTDIAVTNVNLSSLDTIKQGCNRKWKVKDLANLEKGLTLYTGGKTKKFSESSVSLGLTNPGESPGGVTFFDYNNDGHQDIYLVNGLWSGTKDSQEFSFLFGLMMEEHSKKYALRAADNLHFMQLLRQTKGKYAKLSTIEKHIKDGSRPSFGGHQRNRLFRNNGDGTFTDVSYIENVDSIADGYIVGRIDINNDGKIDLILRNADPGTLENQFSPVQLFVNNAPKANYISLTFKGQRSNMDAIGLFAIAHFKDGKKQIHHLEGNSGSMSQQRLIHFGLGKDESLKNLEIHWPSGLVQNFKNLKSGHHHFIEKSALTKR